MYQSIRRVPALPGLAVITALAAALATAAPAPLPGTDTAALQRLAGELAAANAAARGPLYQDLLSRTTGPQGALNANPDLRLVGVDARGLPRFYTVVNADAARTVSTAPLLPGGGSGFDLDGANATGELAIWDAGAVRATHQEFAGGRVTVGDGTASTHWHSTHAGGTMVAAGVVAQARGMSPAATLVSYDWVDDNVEMATAAAGGLLISNHSYGFVAGWYYNSGDGNWYWYGDVNLSQTEDATFGMYTTYSRDWDQVAYDAPYYLIVKAAGNDRGEYPGDGAGHYYWDPAASQWTWSTATRDPDGGADGYDCITTQGIAKNILTIGAVDDIPGGWTQPADVVMSSFSGWGPTDDGRIKPDLVANGIGLYSPLDNSDTAYGTFSGTSMATSNASGSLHLVAQYYRASHGGQPARAATLKALAIHTADEAGPAPGPDYMFGWGLLNTLHCVQLVQADAASGGRIFEDQLAQGERDTFTLYSSGSEPITATLCWTDPPGSPQPYTLNPNTPVLVNDLDLRVERVSDGQVYLPWTLDPADPPAPAVPGDNTLDNVEQVAVAAPAVGLYRLIVSHKGSLTGAPQAYSLVQSGLNNVPPQPPHVEDVTFSQRRDGSGIVDVSYTLEDNDSSQLLVTMEASDDGGRSWNLHVINVEGDIGSNVSPGTGKTITWQFAADNPGVFYDDVVIRVTASDGKCMSVPVLSHHTYNVHLSGNVVLPDNGGNSASGLLVYYDDLYDTKWAILGPGANLTFSQWNWPRFLVGIPYTGNYPDDITGSYTLTVTSTDGGTEGVYQIDSNALVMIEPGALSIPLEGHHSYTVAVSGNVVIPDNYGDQAVGLLLYYDDYYHTKWRILGPGDQVTFDLYNWNRVLAGIPYANPDAVDEISGSFMVTVTSPDGGTEGQYIVDSNHVFIVDQ